MLVQEVVTPDALPLEKAQAKTLFTDRLMWVEVVLLLLFAHVFLAGYKMGVGNQTIQIPFLRQWINPDLFTNDKAVATIRDYPSYFFQGLAWVMKYCDLSRTYLALHLLTSLAMMAACYGLVRSIFRDGLAGVLMVVILFAGHHRALAGDDFYSIGFTHTWAVFPIAVAVFILLYRDHYLMAFLLAGLLFNLHALTAGYLYVMLGFWAVLEIKHLGALRVAGLLGIFLLAASPTLWLMLRHPQVFDAQWLQVTHIRSGEHSFPSTWWQTGSSDIPRFVLLTALWVLSLSFVARGRQQRKTILLILGAGLLFLAGWVLTDIRPVKTVIRAQLFRSSRLVMVLMFAHIAYGVVCAWRLPWRGTNLLSKKILIVERLSGVVTLACLAVPTLLPFLPLAVLLAVVAALLHGRLSWWAAAASGGALLVVLLAWRKIHFVIPGLGDDEFGQMIAHAQWPAPGFWVALGVALTIYMATLVRPGLVLRGLIAFLGAGICGLMVWGIHRNFVSSILENDPWVQVQRWAAKETPTGSLFLTPVYPGGFRVHSNRPVVAEWRDGTQAYFANSFARYWDGAIKVLQPGMMFDAKGERRLSAGKSLGELPDDRIIDLAKSFEAQFIVLPASKNPRNLKQVYPDDKNKNSAWAVYKPKPAWREGVADEALWQKQEEFVEKVALPNIEKYRKSDARIALVDSSGQPLRGFDYQVRQTNHLFGFGCSLPFFAPVDGETIGDFRPPVVTQKELDRFLEIFNYSVIPFSGKWMYIEPTEGDRHYEELDKYVDWCAKNSIRMEFHYLSGLWPRWVSERVRSNPSSMAAIFLKHSMDLVDRYADRIPIWQVENDAYLLAYCPPVFEAIHKKYPQLRLGAGHCTRFFEGGASGGLMRRSALGGAYLGMADLKYLIQNKQKVDFFAMHGHSPHGLWPDVHKMYEVFDTFAKEGTRVHVTEVMVPMSQIVGPVRSGHWTPELRAEFFEQFYTVCFSHPAVDVVNYWSLGPDQMNPGSGLLDDNYQPTPEFLKLKELIKTRWNTRLSGRLNDQGSVDFRGFHGEYEMEVTLSSGKVVTGKFTVKPEQANSTKLTLDEDAGTLK